MLRRRFGRTNLQIPVLSCGGMRYQYKWQDAAPEEIPLEQQENLEACIHRALELGINHIETARGYGTSEMQLGRILPGIQREKLIIQTKVGPRADAAEFVNTFEKSMAYLHLEYVDMLSFHGVNTLEHLEHILKPGGCLEAMRKLQKEGRVRHVGFSTHGACSVILKAIESDVFEYLNLHWYYVNPINTPAVEAAAKRDMGVFIISPTDKGGMLQKPSAKMEQLCSPLLPMQFNDLFCLSHHTVHTLSIGASRPSDFDAHVEALPYLADVSAALVQPLANIQGALEAEFGEEWVNGWWKGLPEYTETPGGVNVQEILRLYTFGKALDLMEWAKGRYNLLTGEDHWVPGRNSGEIDEDELLPLLEESPFPRRVIHMLREAHEELAGEQLKRLSQSVS